MKNFSFLSRNEEVKSLAIGKFDGLHLAHKKILDSLISPSLVIIIDSGANESLMPIFLRKKLIKNSIVVSLESIKNIDGKIFIEAIKNAYPNLERIVVGYDFFFGKDRQYCSADLSQFFNGEVLIISRVSYENMPIHSSVIRDLIVNGEVMLASKMLGQNYAIYAREVKGQGLGSKSLVPTINLESSGFVLPQNGVYITKINNENSISFIGHRVSTDAKFAIESHILDSSRVGIVLDSSKDIKLEFIKRIRDNRHFSDLNILKEQIKADIQTANDFFRF